MFLQTRNSLLTRPLVAPAISRRLLSSRPNILPKNGSTNISKFAIAAGCFVVGGATTVATVVCEQDRMERWNDRWATGNVAWHRSKPNTGLVDHYDRFLGVNAGDAQEVKQKHRVLIPLCGKSVDMPYLVDQGHEVVGVEGVETAAWQLQRDAWLTFEVSKERAKTDSSAAGVDRQRPDFIAAPTFDRTRPGYVFKTDAEGTGYYLDAKAITWFRDTKKPLSMAIHDFLHLTPQDLGTFDRIWDRAALVAIRPEDREDYVAVCDSLLEPGGLILLVTLVYDQDNMKGPPFSIPLEEVQRLYGSKLGYKIETLSSFDARKDYKGRKWDKLQTAGLDETAFILTKPSYSGPGWFSRVFLRRKALQ